MGAVEVKKREYKGWKNCIEITNGLVELIATTDVGPRIISFGFPGGKNELCEVEAHIGTTGGDEFKMYGGHRLWHSPETKPRTYQPDNSKVQWKKKKNGIVLSQETEAWTYIKKEMEIVMSPDAPEIKVIHRLTNKGAWAVELAVWALTVMAPGGKEILPQNSRETGLLPNRMLSLWPYTKLNDSRVYWGEKYITIQQDKNATTDFKIGLPIEDGWAAYANNGHLFVKQFQHIDGVIYPDYSASSYETFTNDYMLEMETLSPLVLLEPEETVEHTESWALYDNVKVPDSESEIDQLILPYIKK